MGKIVVALVLLLSATSLGLAQSQPNYGPNGPSRSDCFGQPYSGTIAARCTPHYWHYRHYWR